MSKKIIGKCRLCGKENVELTFEHVPPESAFNNQRVQLINRSDALECLTNPDKRIEDIDKLHYVDQQRGDGGYYLCADCNSKTGKWYVKAYSEFIQSAMKVIAPNDIKHGTCFKLETHGIYPLSILKQVMVMFCDINPTLSEDVYLRNFLLNRNSNEFDKTKYRIFMFGFGGGYLRRSSCFGTFDSNTNSGMIQSEIISPPVGFNLYIDPPENLKSLDCEITDFAFVPYNKMVDVEFILHTKGTYSMFPGIYIPEKG